MTGPLVPRHPVSRDHNELFTDFKHHPNPFQHEILLHHENDSATPDLIHSTCLLPYIPLSTHRRFKLSTKLVSRDHIELFIDFKHHPNSYQHEILLQHENDSAAPDIIKPTATYGLQLDLILASLSNLSRAPLALLAR